MNYSDLLFSLADNVLVSSLLSVFDILFIV